MKKIGKILLGVVGVVALLVGILCAVASTRPDTYTVTRSLDIAKPADAIMPNITDMRAWSRWSPWEEMDPAMQKVYSEPSSGVGSWYTWTGPKAGKGKMTVTAITATRVDIDLSFVEPFPSEAKVHFDVMPAANGSRVTWTMEGNNNFMGKVFGLFMDMDKMIGKDFEHGLDKLSRL